MATPLPAPDPRPGALLAGKYRLQVEIGRGAMGTVWRATNENLGQSVAIKIISPEHAGSAELRERFDTEARAAAKLNSRFVVSVYDNGETDTGLPFIVMELLDGECLEDRIARQGCLPLPEVARIARHLTRGLSKAHAQGIIHRDLKPANIFLTRSDEEEDGDDWTAKILDFGIAKMDDFRERSTTQTGTVLGTPLFMSPEQVRGASSVDLRADLYSFGMVVFNMLTGTFAFEGQSFGDLLVSICVDPLPNLTHIAPHLPRELDLWFQKACARDAGQRFNSAEEMLYGLQLALGEQTSPQSLQMVSTAHSGTLAAPAYPLRSEPSWPRVSSGLSPHLDSSGAATMTLHEAPKRRSRARLAGTLAFAVLFVLGAAAALRFGLPGTDDPASASRPTVLEIPEPVQVDSLELNPAGAPAASKHVNDTTQVRPSAGTTPQGMELDALPFEEESSPRRAAPSTTSSRPKPQDTSKPLGISKPQSASKPRRSTPDLGF